MHPFWPFFDRGRHFPQLLSQNTYICYSSTNIAGQRSSNLLPYYTCEFRPITVRADHDLKRTVAVYAAKVEVTLRRDISNVRSDFSFLAELPYLCRSIWIIHSGENHINAIKIGRFKFSIPIIHLRVVYSISYLIVQSTSWRHNGDFGVSVENIQYPPSRYLSCVSESSELEITSLGRANFSASNYKYSLIFDLPRKY